MWAPRSVVGAAGGERRGKCVRPICHGRRAPQARRPGGPDGALVGRRAGVPLRPGPAGTARREGARLPILVPGEVLQVRSWGRADAYGSRRARGTISPSRATRMPPARIARSASLPGIAAGLV